MTTQPHARRSGLGRRLALGVPAIGLAGALLVGAAVTDVAAQDSRGGSINIGGSIADTVAGAVSGIATGGGSASGGTQVEHSDIHLGDQEGVAISDASGGNHNLSANSK
jgi:hypothetical protein